jgi:hypothetical protein
MNAIPDSVEPSLPENLRPLAAEIAVYHRELPRLLEEQEEGRFIVIQGNQILGTWDSYRDALQQGCERCPDGMFLAQRIDARDVERLAPFLSLPGETCQS